MASALPLGFFVKRVWLFIPIFTGIIVIPAMFSFITPGTIVLPLWPGTAIRSGSPSRASPAPACW